MKKLIVLSFIIVLVALSLACDPTPTNLPPTEVPPTPATTPHYKATEKTPKGDTAPTPWVNGLPDTGGGKTIGQMAIEGLAGIAIVAGISLLVLVIWNWLTTKGESGK
jgi:hypothetical protein